MPPRRYQQLSPEQQRALVSEYKDPDSKESIKDVADRYRIPKSTAHSIIDRAERNDGDPVAPRGHRKRKLDQADERKLRRTLARDPCASNTTLAAAVDHKIDPSTVSRYLARMDPPYTQKVIQDQEPEELGDRWKETCNAWLAHIQAVPWRKRIYADETAIYGNAAPKKGRSPAGQPIFRPRPHWSKKYTMHVFVKEDRVLFWELCDHNANDKEVQRVASWAVDYLPEGDTLIWDRLGRSGRARNPVKQHYNPRVHRWFRKAGVSVEFLPPKGKYFNPLELLFGDLKAHYIEPAYPGDGTHMTKQQLHAIIENYMEQHAPTALPGFFRMRASGRYAREHELL